MHPISGLFIFSMLFWTYAFSPLEIKVEDHGLDEPYWNINMAHEPDK